ncbi:MAG: 16S rRNA (cytidine(1402)-2'-O)-methyltransferase [Deltaproteobacteria bacterium]
MNESANEKQGMLYMVATPIGNLEDITLRALRVLKEVDLIAAEDTRHSRILLNAYDIKTPLISLHEHNEQERSALIVSRIKDGMSVAYISDAGTPCISDPGYRLVSVAQENNIRVVPIPGPSALIAALSACGFPADQFLFCGFLPPKENKRRRFLESVKDEEKSIIFYESPSRMTDTLQVVHDVLGDRQVVVARELTKLFEEIKRGTVSDILAEVSAIKCKGEFTVILQGSFPEPVSLTDDEIRERLRQLMEKGSLSVRDAVAGVVRQTGLSRKKVYDIAVKYREVPD